MRTFWSSRTLRDGGGRRGSRGAHKANIPSSSEPTMTKRLLPLIPGGLVVEQVLPEPDRVTVVARSRLPTAACPDCHASSSRVHSRYERRLADLPWQGRPVAVRLRARRFLCAEPPARGGPSPSGCPVSPSPPP